MVRSLVFGLAVYVLSAIAAQAQVMTDTTAATARPMPQVGSGPGAGQSYFEGSNECSSSCNDSCRQCVDCCSYLKTFGGWTGLEDFESDFVGVQVVGAFDNGYCIGGAIGRKIRPRLNAEIEFAYRQNEADELSLSLPRQGATTVDLEGNINVYSGMTNFLFESCRQIDRLSPYAGAGAGFAIVNADLTTPTIDFLVDDSGFAYQFIAGVSKAIRCNADVFVEYRYFAVEDQQFEDPSGTIVLDVDYRTNNVLFGVRLCH